MANEANIPQAFIFRRLHSITGVFLVLFLTQHLLTNSQAALLIGEDGQGFIHDVNKIHSLPYLPFIEIGFLAAPFLLHMLFGIQYLLTAKQNYFRTDQRGPILKYPLNRAYTLQRITAFFLLFLIVFHVVHMRFLKYPDSVKVGAQTFYFVPVTIDPGLLSVSARLNVKVYNEQMIEEKKASFAQKEKKIEEQEALEAIEEKGAGDLLTLSKTVLERQKESQENAFLQALTENQAKQGAIAVADNFGTAELMMLRETFKDPFMIGIYVLFVLFASYHAFTGLYTACISWGITLTERSKRLIHKIALFLMILVSFFGLAAAIGTFYINLRY